MTPGEQPDGEQAQGGRAGYEAEIRVAVRYERGLAVKALLPLALAGVVIEGYRILHG